MNRSISRIGGILLALSFLTAATSPRATAQNVTLSDLTAVSYSKTSSPDLSAWPSDRDIADTAALARAYARGEKLLPSYHEPILTRSGSGVNVFRTSSPSVVLIVVGDVKNNQFDPTGLGAGVIINPGGDILTNWHVIDGYGAAMVFLKPAGRADMEESNAYVGRVIAQNETSDLALVRLTQGPANLTPIPIGSISSIQVAEDIHVIGHPHGNLWSYSTGVVSQIRDDYAWSYSDGSKHMAKVLQLQTAINPGNSGGPVLDDQGRLLGLIAMSEEGQNLDYAVASDVIQSFLASQLSGRTRGGQSSGSTDRADYSVGRLPDGSTALRATFPKLTEYIIKDKSGRVIELVGKTSDDVTLEATQPNSFGGFEQWSITLPNGSTVQAKGSGEVPNHFSLK